MTFKLGLRYFVQFRLRWIWLTVSDQSGVTCWLSIAGHKPLAHLPRWRRRLFHLPSVRKRLFWLNRPNFEEELR